ncbi:MAG: hypothetical protein IPP14_00290 [Planctomycetes bacterium]|nr:hypothetical protein [Planctomycetota bacterium]
MRRNGKSGLLRLSQLAMLRANLEAPGAWADRPAMGGEIDDSANPALLRRFVG